MNFARVVNSLKPIAVAIARIDGDNAILSDVQTLLVEVRRYPYCPAHFTVAPSRRNCSSEMHQKE
jgi:hypothetical protein